ncbi:MAG TPA: winged helix-turn-helix domain-containing protein [Ideonella sp.]|nr:winged helix-turn-helix domain-containing protein [Ideonella sp.]
MTHPTADCFTDIDEPLPLCEAAAARHVPKGPHLTALRFGPFTLWPARGLLLGAGDRPSPLAGRPLALLAVLAARAGEVVSQRELMSLAWPGEEIAESSLRRHVATLRQALGDGEDGARYVANIAARGYCFVTPVEHLPRALLPPRE